MNSIFILSHGLMLFRYALAFSTPALLPGKSHGRRSLVGYGLPGASMRNPTHNKVMRKEAWQNLRTWSDFRGSPWNFLSIYPPKIRVCLLLHSSDTLWKKSNQGFSLLHLKAMFQLNPSDSSLACLTGSPDLLQLWIAYSPPTQPREVQSLKAS